MKTREDERAGYFPDDLEGLIRQGYLTDRQKEDAAFRLLEALRYDEYGVDQTDEHHKNGLAWANLPIPHDITDELMEVAETWIQGNCCGGDGVEALDELFAKRDLLYKVLIIDFVRRFRVIAGKLFSPWSRKLPELGYAVPDGRPLKAKKRPYDA